MQEVTTYALIKVSEVFLQRVTIQRSFLKTLSKTEYSFY